MPLESLKVSLQSLDALFPFNLIIRQHTDLSIIHLGPALLKTLNISVREINFEEYFFVERPINARSNYSSLIKFDGELVRLACKKMDFVLRGQILEIEKNTLAFLGSIDIKTASSMQEFGISFADFTPVDQTPDMLILQRMKEMQLSELAKKNNELSTAIRDRNEFGRHANTDAMTGLLNRRGFLATAKAYIKDSHSTEPHAVCIIDVNNFKVINDSYGHSAGDAVLREVAHRLTILFSKESVIGRWGGDEFVLLIDAKQSSSEYLNDNSVLKRLQYFVHHKHKKIKISLSIGIAYTSISKDISKLIHYADLTMYESRKEGEGQVAFFEGDNRKAIEHRENISNLLELAIENEEFTVFYQPIVDLNCGNTASFEALARWNHKDLGMISPVDFIEVAESKGLMVEFDKMMLSLVVKQLVDWRTVYSDIKVQINFSAPSFTSGFSSRIQKILKNNNLPNNCIVVELTETSLLLRSDQVILVIKELVELGFAVELDDFGTGYSSLLHLKDFPVTGIKVDVDFIQDASVNQRSRTLLKNIIELANQLDLKAVAEGVETEEQREMLVAMNCKLAQGYYFAKPAPALECGNFLENCISTHSVTDSDSFKAA